MADSTIEWTNKTWNPVRGCALVSEGCRNCYAMRQAYRFNGEGMPYEGLTHIVNGHPVWTGKVICDESKLDEPLHWKKPARIFVNSMSDLFHEKVPDSFLMSVFSTMCAAKRHTFQILTKRPVRMQSFLSQWASMTRDFGPLWPNMWPQKHIWLGVSVEDQKTADERIPLLLQTPAAVRWISYEPALSPVDLERGWFSLLSPVTSPSGTKWPGLNWVVCGGESGPGARPFNIQWARDVVAQCKTAGVPCFVKQLGRFPFDVNGDSNPERYQYNANNHLRLNDRKGGDMDEWPEDLRVREYPCANS